MLNYPDSDLDRGVNFSNERRSTTYHQEAPIPKCQNLMIAGGGLVSLALIIVPLVRTALAVGEYHPGLAAWCYLLAAIVGVPGGVTVVAIAREPQNPPAPDLEWNTIHATRPV